MLGASEHSPTTKSIKDGETMSLETVKNKKAQAIVGLILMTLLITLLSRGSAKGGSEA